MIPTNLLMAIGGGFFGVTVALLVGFIAARGYVVWKIREWAGDAHRGGVCPICKRAMAHDDCPAPDEPGG